MKKKPRLCVNLRNRSNIPHCSTYYMRTILIPHLEDLISSLDDRFMPQKETIISLQNILPSICINNSFLFIHEADDFYNDDLPGYKDSLEAEYDLWISKWTSVIPSSRPTSTYALISCDRILFPPNLCQLLKILAILPVSICRTQFFNTAKVKNIFEKLNFRESSRRFSIYS